MSLNCDSRIVLNDNKNEIKTPRYHLKLLLQAFIILSATFSNLSDGMGTGWTSTAIAQMMKNTTNTPLRIDSYQAALIGTLPMYAIFCAAPISIYSANKIGRKYTILWGTTLSCISWLCLIFGNNITSIYSGAFLRGLGGSVIFTIIPMYSAEIAHASIRGFLGSFVPAMMNIGVLLSYITTIYEPLWVTATIAAVSAGIVWPLFIWAPRSPYHILVSRGDLEDAKFTLEKLHGKGGHVDIELENMKVAAEEEIRNRENRVPILELITVPTNRKVTIIVVAIQFIQQLTGIDAILIYLEFILDDKNSTIIFGIAKLLSCLLSLLLLDRLGRKPLLIFSCVMSCVMLLVLGSYFYIRDNTNLDISGVKMWLPLASLVVFISCYNMGLGTISFILGGEMYPTRIKALGVTFGEVMYALPMIIATQLFALTHEAYGVHFPFWVYAGCSFVGAVFIWRYVIETKGKTLEEIQEELKNR